MFRLNARVQSVKDSDVIYRDAVTGEEDVYKRQGYRGWAFRLSIAKVPGWFSW